MSGIHHFVEDCSGEGASCNCSAGLGGVQDCYVYDAISGATQTGPNVFTLVPLVIRFHHLRIITQLAALRYAGTTGNITWLADVMPTLRRMMGFLDTRFNSDVGLYLAPGYTRITLTLA